MATEPKEYDFWQVLDHIETVLYAYNEEIGIQLAEQEPDSEGMELWQIDEQDCGLAIRMVQWLRDNASVEEE